MRQSKNLLLSIFYVVFIKDSDLNEISYRSSRGKIIAKFYLLDLIKISRKLLWRFDENRSPLHSLFLVLVDFNFKYWNYSFRVI